MRKALFVLFSLLVSACAFAQDNSGAPAGDQTGLRADEKIYVVVAVLATILAGFFIYLIRLDRKISRMEKKS